MLHVEKSTEVNDKLRNITIWKHIVMKNHTGNTENTSDEHAQTAGLMMENQLTMFI